MTAPSSYILTSCQPFRSANSPVISRKTLLTTQHNWKLSPEVLITTRNTINWQDTGKAQLNTTGKRTELSSIYQAEDRVLYLLYPSTFTSSPVIFVHYGKVMLANTSSAQVSGTTTTCVLTTLLSLLLHPLALSAPAILLGLCISAATSL